MLYLIQREDCAVFSVAGDTLALSLNGKEAVRVRNAAFKEGCVVLTAHPKSRVQFRQIDVLLPAKSVTP